MDGQTSIPVDDSPDPSGPCAWCGEPITVPLIVEPARFGKAANGVRVLRKRPVVVPACREHAEHFGMVVDAPFWGDND
jgi:hypothetical protein